MEQISFIEKIDQLDQKARMDELVQQEKYEEDARKNHDFVQFTRHGLDNLGKLDATAIKVFLLISKEMNRENKLIISQKTLATLLDYSRQTISTAIKSLIHHKFLTILKSGSTNIFCLNSDVVWSTDNQKRQYASFTARVYISEDEQREEPPVKILKNHVKQITLGEE